MKWLVEYNNTNGSLFCIWREIGAKRWSAAEIFDYTLTGPLLTLMIICGVVGGLLCIRTFQKFLPKLEIYRHLLALALWDLCFVLTSFFLYNLPTLLWQEILTFGNYVLVTPFLYYASSVARIGSIWTVLVLAVHKYFALCHPFKFHEANTKERTHILMAVVLIFALVFSLPRLFETEVKYCYEVTTSKFVPSLPKSKLRWNYGYWVAYRIIGGGLFYSFIPFLALTWLTCRLWIELRRIGAGFSPVAGQQQPTQQDPQTLVISSDSAGLQQNGSLTQARGSLTESSSLRRQSTATGGHGEKMNHGMHVAVITKFLLCHIFPTILDVWESTGLDRSAHSSPRWILMTHSVMFLATLNGSCNFFIYYVTSAMFRHDCRKTVSSLKLCKNG